MLISTLISLFALPARAQTGLNGYHPIIPVNEYSARITWPQASDYWVLNGTAAVSWDYTGPSNITKDVLFLLVPLFDMPNPEPNSTAYWLLDHHANATHKATVVPLKYAMTHDVMPGRYELWATTEYGAIGKAPRVACDYAESHLASVRGSAPMPDRECYVFRHGQPVLFEIRGNGTDMPKAAEIAGLAARANGTSGTVGPSGSAQSASPTSGGYIASLSTAAAVVAGAVVAVLL